MKKKLCLIAMLVVAGFAAFAQSQATTSKDASKETSKESKAKMSLAEARGMIDAILADSSGGKMREVMKQLSAEDQKQFLADVNKAISDMPASVEEKTAKYLNMNHAAVASAQEGNTTALLGQVFATVPPEALTVICEKFATDVLNRGTDSRYSYTDEQYAAMAGDIVKAVLESTKDLDNSSPRAAFAIIMLVRASNGTPADLADKLIENLPTDEAKELAKTEWVPNALGKDDRSQSYESLLASADAGRRPDFDFVLVIAGPQYLDSVLHDVGGKNVDNMSFIRTNTPVLDAVENPLANQIPDIGTGAAEGGNTPAPPPDEPRPYNGQ